MGCLASQVPLAQANVYADICMLYTQSVINTCSAAVVVFDGYYGGASIKDETHHRRAENYRHTLVHLCQFPQICARQ